MSTTPPRMRLLLALLLTLTGCASLSSLDPPSVDLAGLGPMPSDDGQPRFLITLRVANPNAKDLHIEGIYYELSVEGHKLFNGASAKPTTIPAYAEGELTLTAAPSLLGAIGLFKTLVTSNPNPDRIRYSLNTKLSMGRLLPPIRLNRKGELSLNPDSLLPGIPALGA